jgi:hypothetical protein
MNNHDRNLPKYKSFRITKEESRDQEIDHTAWDQKSTKPLCNNPGLAADFWRCNIGVNVIPANKRKKCPNIQWKQYQDCPIPDWQYKRWIKDNAFSKGMAVIPWRAWHRKDKIGQYLICLDADKQKAIEELCTRNGKTISLQGLAQKILVEQHNDNADKAHIYFYSPIPFPKKSADSILGLEIKGLGGHGIIFCSPSIHKDESRRT